MCEFHLCERRIALDFSSIYIYIYKLDTSSVTPTKAKIGDLSLNYIKLYSMFVILGAHVFFPHTIMMYIIYDIYMNFERLKPIHCEDIDDQGSGQEVQEKV